MIKNSFLLLCCVIFVQACAQTRKLEDGRKVLTKKYKNSKRFDRSIYNDIHTDYFYQKIDYYMADKNYSKIRDIGKDVDRRIQFYDNGRMRFLSFTMDEPDPEKTGMRGVIYLKNGKLKIDTQEADQGGRVFKGTYSAKVEGDKLYILHDNFLIPPSEYVCYVYQKSEKIPENWKQYKADW
ncbi:hypothetical protein M9991_18705 [Chryseobacterium gallinarum]|uniref:hypothetical protein n=1 Tax=Chryseobacterium gallinarum TaxID=1324352 RepID=UPI0020244D95|nr:hypothetical protein [Chryseobacterium gallinarum]MCL8538904.1 hypothetical protein [Chryseobacterium gallinarum]